MGAAIRQPDSLAPEELLTGPERNRPRSPALPVTNTEVRLPELTVDPTFNGSVVKWHGDEDLISHSVAREGPRS